MRINAAAGDEIPAACEVIELRVGELRQLFNAIDPAPFHQRDLDPKAEESHRRLGRNVETHRGLPLRLVADPFRGPPRIADESETSRNDVFHKEVIDGNGH